MTREESQSVYAQGEEAQEKEEHTWAAQMTQWMQDAKAAADKARERGKPSSENLAELTQRYDDALLATPCAAHPVPNLLPKKTPFWLLLLDCLRDYREYVLTFGQWTFCSDDCSCLLATRQ